MLIVVVICILFVRTPRALNLQGLVYSQLVKAISPVLEAERTWSRRLIRNDCRLILQEIRQQGGRAGRKCSVIGNPDRGR